MIDHRKFNFMMHCGAEVISREDLGKLICPEADETTGWTPIPHHNYVDQIEDCLSVQGLRVANQGHAITHNRNRGDMGDRYFGFLQLEGGNGRCEVVGLRNSHDRTFAASLVMGMGVFVCDNLSFSGEIKISRKHTRYIRRDLPNLAARAVARLGEVRNFQEHRVELYQGNEVDRKDVHDLVMQSFRTRALPSSQIGHVIDAYEAQPEHEDYAEAFGDRTAWSLFNAFTEVYKNRVNPHVLSQRTQLLHGVFDNYLGVSKPTTAVEV